MTRTRTMTRTQALAELARRGLGTHEEALARRVDLDVAKWGERERAASRRLHERASHALLVNSIAVSDVEHLDEELMRLAAVVFTAADRAALRSGG